MCQVDKVQDILHHLLALTEPDVVKEAPEVLDRVVPHRGLDQDLALVPPGVLQWHDVDSSLVTSLLTSDHQRIDHVNTHVVATEITNYILIIIIIIIIGVIFLYGTC